MESSDRLVNRGLAAEPLRSWAATPRGGTVETRTRSWRTSVRCHVGAIGFASILLMSAFGCDDSTQPPVEAGETPLELRHLAVHSIRVQYAQSHVVESEHEWRELWESHSRDGVPEVDFSRHELVAVFWGDRPAGCSDRVEAIERAVVRSGRVEVEVGPLPELGECSAIVSPYDIVEIPRTDLPVVLVGEVPW